MQTSTFKKCRKVRVARIKDHHSLDMYCQFFMIIFYSVHFLFRMVMVYWKDTRTRGWRIFWNFITKLQSGMMVCL